MDNIQKALRQINRSITDWDRQGPLHFEEFLHLATVRPQKFVRNIFQAFHDMIFHYLGDGADEYPNDPESIHFVHYDCSQLFVDDVDHPFFADRLFSNRLVNLAESLNRGAQQNKIYIFEGPPGSGKSTFLNNLLLKFEKYTSSEDGTVFETVWRLNRYQLGGKYIENEANSLLEKLSQLTGSMPQANKAIQQINRSLDTQDEFIEIPCPSHDHPILMIPKPSRRSFCEDLFKGHEFRDKLLNAKEFDWIYRDTRCTICHSLFHSLLNKFRDPEEVLRNVYVRPFYYNRRLGEGISVFTPGDKPLKQTILTNDQLQSQINRMFRDSNLVRYIYSRFAKTNNGIYALMDIKSHNIERMIELHNIISEGLHKVEDIEENVNSLFLAVMNPEDRKNIADFPSFSDRIEYIKIPYVLDLNTEVEIYRNIFGRHIDDSFLPRVLHNFARVIIASRMRLHSDAMVEWIDYPSKYRQYCDDNLQLLKMEIYTGHIPKWLSEEDRKKLTAKRRRRIIKESETDGEKGFSGRDSIKIFNDFYSHFVRKDKMINMSDLCNFFTKVRKSLSDQIPSGILDSLLRMYNYTVLQEVKESLYYYNEAQIAREILNYIFAVNFESGSRPKNQYTGETIEINEAFFEGIEKKLMGSKIEERERLTFRRDTQREYTARTLTQEVMSDGKDIHDTELFHSLHERYVHNLKEKVLDPFLENENFRNAIKDFGRDDFKTYDRKIREDVTFLINNLCTKYHYTRYGAKEVCIYVIDSNLAKTFSSQ